MFFFRLLFPEHHPITSSNLSTTRWFKHPLVGGHLTNHFKGSRFHHPKKATNARRIAVGMLWNFPLRLQGPEPLICHGLHGAADALANPQTAATVSQETRWVSAFGLGEGFFKHLTKKGRWWGPGGFAVGFVRINGDRIHGWNITFKWDILRWNHRTDPNNPDPSRWFWGFLGNKIPSEKNRNVGVIPFPVSQRHSKTFNPLETSLGIPAPRTWEWFHGTSRALAFRRITVHLLLIIWRSVIWIRRDNTSEYTLGHPLGQPVELWHDWTPKIYST